MVEADRRAGGRIAESGGAKEARRSRLLAGTLDVSFEPGQPIAELPVVAGLAAGDDAVEPRRAARSEQRRTGGIEEGGVGDRAGEARTEIAAEMRYDGQGYDVTVPLERGWLASGDIARIGAAFHEAHRGTYGHANEAAQIWLKELRAHIVGEVPKPPLAPLQVSAGEATVTTRPIRLFGQSLTVAVVDRAAFAGTIAGPAIINQMDTTTLVPPGWQARRIAAGALILERVATEGKAAQ